MRPFCPVAVLGRRMMAWAAFSPLIWLLCVLAAAITSLVLFIPARIMVRSERNGLRAFGAVLIPLMSAATLAFAVVAAINFVIAAYFYGSMASVAGS